MASRIGNSYYLVLRSAPGLDVIQGGVTTTFINGRGFNSRFNTRWLTLEDDRIAILAEIGLPIGKHTTVPRLDIASMEVITGLGSALYGANASNGLLSIRTKDPRHTPGFSWEVSGGSRSLMDVQARYSGLSGKLGYKISGEHLQVNDWPIVISYPAVTPGGNALPESIVDFETGVSRASGSVMFYFSDASKLQFHSGVSVREGLGDSNSGHCQIDNYTYTNQQLAFTSPRWFAQKYFTHSHSGETYQLYAAVPMQPRNPLLSADSVRELTRFHVDGRLYAAEVQNNFLVGHLVRTGVSLIDNSLITWGGQIDRVRVSSYEPLLTDALTKKPILLDNKGVYSRVETRLTSSVRMVISARYDAATRYDPQFSPRVSMLYTPALDQTIRVTYGEAYRSPPILNTDAYNLGEGIAGGIDAAFRSGVLWGQLPSFGSLDLSMNYRLPKRNTTFVAQAQNIADCVSGVSIPPVHGLSASNNATCVKGSNCGMGMKHQELLSMPALGPMVFAGVRQDWR